MDDQTFQADLNEAAGEASSALARLGKYIQERYPDDQELGDRFRAYLRSRERLAGHLQIQLTGRQEPPAVG